MSWVNPKTIFDALAERTYVLLTFHKSFNKDITSIRLRKGSLNICKRLVGIARAVKSNYEFFLKHRQKY